MIDLFGIDFGTTNSATGTLFKGDFIKFGDEYGQPYPSLIAIDKMTGEVVFRGRDVWHKRNQLQDRCEIISSVKLVLGSDVSWNIGGRTWTPEQVTAEIFKGLKETIHERTGIETGLSEACISIPIGFSPAKRKSLRIAASSVGIDVKGFISEPTAAVYRHYDDIKRWKKIAVFDWGGGTLDISVVELRNGAVHEVATSGHSLGGDDLDREIAQWAHSRILREKGGKKSFEEMSPNLRDNLIVRAEEVKRALSDTEEDFIILHQYGEFGPVNIKLNREMLLRLLKQKIEDVVSRLEYTIKEARMSPEELGCILMVGGSSKLFGLLDKMEEKFKCEIIPPDHESDWHVAHGAALLGTHGGNYVISQNIGLVLSDDSFFPLFEKGEKVDYNGKTINFGLVEDTNNARFIIIEANNNNPNAFKSKQFRIIGYLDVPTFGFRREPIKLEANIDEDLLLRLTAVSERRNDKHKKSWDYPELRFIYELPRQL